MKIDPETLYLQLGHLVATMPDMTDAKKIGPEERLWLGRAAALIELAGGLAFDTISFQSACDNLGGVLHEPSAHSIASIVNRALARAELAAPAATQGQFIAAGDTLTAFAAVAKVLGSAKKDILLVDAYADQTVITDSTAPKVTWQASPSTAWRSGLTRRL